MKLCVLGGTVFLGRAIVDAALARGHELTLFNRGKSGTELFPDVEKLRGDRDGDLVALYGRTFDAVIDVCGYVPRIVGDSARLLADACDHYTFVSSQSVYADSDTPGQDESAPLINLDDPTVEDVTPETYGGLKALCEDAVLAAFLNRALIVRPGLIVGPNDPTDRFTYWPARIARGGPVLVPNPPDAPLQFTDVRDLAAWTVESVESKLAGTFNLGKTCTRRELFEACRNVSGSDAEFVWADFDWLAGRDVTPWVDLPLCVEPAGFMTRASAATVRYRAIEETVRDTLTWFGDRELSAGLTADREATALADL